MHAVVCYYVCVVGHVMLCDECGYMYVLLMCIVCACVLCVYVCVGVGACHDA